MAEVVDLTGKNAAFAGMNDIGGEVDDWGESDILMKADWTRLSYMRVIMRHEVLHVSRVSSMSRRDLSWGRMLP